MGRVREAGGATDPSLPLENLPPDPNAPEGPGPVLVDDPGATGGPAARRDRITVSSDERDDAPDDSFFGRIIAFGTGIVRRVDEFQQDHRPLALAFAVWKKFGEDRAGNLAALVSYYLFFSIFPLLMAFTTILGFALQSNPDLQGRLLDSALGNFPVVGDQLKENIGTVQGSGVVLAVGVLVALWAGMGAIGAMQNSMNTIWNVPMMKRPNMLQERLRSLAMLVFLALTVALSTVIGSLAGGAGSFPVIGRVLVVLPTFAINVVLFIGSFMILTNKDLSWRQVLPGAVVAGVFFTFLQTVGAAYVNHVVQGAGRTYGTFAVVLGLLSWLYMQAQLTVLAAEVNVVRERGLWPRSLTGDPLTPADRRALRHYAAEQERHPDETIDVDIDADL